MNDSIVVYSNPIQKFFWESVVFNYHFWLGLILCFGWIVFIDFVFGRVNIRSRVSKSLANKIINCFLFVGLIGIVFILMRI